MGVVFDSGVRTDPHANEKLTKILEKLEEITNGASNNEIVSSHGDNAVLHRKGKMFWWDKSEEVAIYKVTLYILDDEVATIELDRNLAYYTFKDLDGYGIYRFKLEKENRDGNIIGKAEMKF